MANKLTKVMHNGTEYELGGGDITSSNKTYDDIIYLSQADFEALATKEPNTLYSTPDDESGAFEPENVGTTGQVLTKTSTGYNWDNAPETGIQLAPNSPLQPPYHWYGTEEQYQSLSQYYTDTPGDTVYYTV